MTDQANASIDPTAGLTLLGQTINHPSRQLETFPNQHPGRHLPAEVAFRAFLHIFRQLSANAVAMSSMIPRA